MSRSRSHREPESLEEPESEAVANFLAQPKFVEDEAVEAAAVDQQSREAPREMAGLPATLLSLGRPHGGGV